MDGAKIIGTLESMGFTFGLAIDCKSPSRPTAEAVALLDMLEGQKESAIDYLISGRFVRLPEDIAIPAEWNLNRKMRKYITDAPNEILNALQVGHNPLFALLGQSRHCVLSTAGSASISK